MNRLARPIHIFVLFSLSVTQPLLDVISREDAFFIVRGNHPSDVLWLLFFLCLVLPGIFAVIELVSSFAGKPVQSAVYGSILGLLFSLFFLRTWNKVGLLSGYVCLALSLATTLFILWFYYRSNNFRSTFTFLIPVLVVVPALFLFNPSVSKFIHKSSDSQIPRVKIDSTTPVILVVLDELPISSLLDKNDSIDRVAFPNFARLAQQSTWYQNVTASSDVTPEAVPAILTGSYPEKRRTPQFGEYPLNLFTLLENSYNMEIFETGTSLEPPSERRRMEIESTLKQRMQSLLADLSAIYLQVVLPADFSGYFPSTGQSWSGFWDGGTDKVHPTSAPNRSDRFHLFLNSIRNTKKPTLYFIHSLLPHGPFEFLPSGFRYNFGRWTTPLAPEDNADPWNGDVATADRAFQRHLLQLAFVDRMLGRTIDKLTQTGLYDRSLFILTADHGTSFLADQARRKLTDFNRADITIVPLFIKLPEQRVGELNKKFVETVDILPTIADVLKVKIPWHVDGHSVRDSLAPNRKQKRLVAWFDYDGVSFNFDQPDFKDSGNFKRKLQLFGSGQEPDALFRFGPFPMLIGESIQKITEPARGITIHLQNAGWYRSVDLATKFVPALVTGTLKFENPQAHNLALAISVNGTIRATTNTFESRSGTAFAAMLPDLAFHNGGNELGFYVISRGSETKLLKIEILDR